MEASVMVATVMNDELYLLVFCILFLRGSFPMQYEAMGMKCHYLCYEESFKGY